MNLYAPVLRFGRDLIQARLDQRVAKAQLEALVGRDL